MAELPSNPATQAVGEQHKFILASRVEGTNVHNLAGERIGHVDDLSIDRQAGTVVYAINSFGGFLGIGKRFHPVPWSLLSYDPERGGYVVALDEQALRDAPHYDVDELAKLGGARHVDYTAVLNDYYGRYGYLGFQL